MRTTAWVSRIVAELDAATGVDNNVERFLHANIAVLI
jgi:hypothetical protein